jgi:Phytanoyl-CoA dioxygenase (PhyH)
MNLTSQQIEAFEKQGYLFFPNCFAEEEVALLRSEAEKIFRTNRQEVWREKTGAPRTAFAAHTYNEAFRLMAHHPRLVEPLQQLFGEGDQRQGGVRGRCVAMAPGLRHLGPRRRHARAARHEHLDLPR